MNIFIAIINQQKIYWFWTSDKFPVSKFFLFLFVEKFSGQMRKIRISKKNFEFPKRCVPFFFLNFFFSSFVDHGDNDIEHCTIGMFDFTSFLFFHYFCKIRQHYSPSIQANRPILQSASAKSIELSWKKLMIAHCSNRVSK